MDADQKWDEKGPEVISQIRIEEVAAYLTSQNAQWGMIPRTYTLLEDIDFLNLLNDFINHGFRDILFPVTRRDLPPDLPSNCVEDILSRQHIVCNPSKEIGIGDGKHRNFLQGDVLQLVHQKELGRGHYAVVDEVHSTNSGKLYARKRIARLTADPTKVRSFESELKILKRLHHKHIVQFVGSYTDTECFAILMEPVASNNLSEYLAAASRSAEIWPIISEFFGCLATGLEYLHNNRIRHKDIKPQNILVYRGSVLLTDFGLSLAYEHADEASTSGWTPMTRRYCAPEVALQESRNESSDIWSLGCVFLEMAVVLQGRSMDDQIAFFRSRGSIDSSYWQNELVTAKWIETLRGESQLMIHVIPLSWIANMLQHDRNRRPTASSLVRMICDNTDRLSYARYFCGKCCLLDDRSNSNLPSMSAKDQMTVGSDREVEAPFEDAAKDQNGREDSTNAKKPLVSLRTRSIQPIESQIRKLIREPLYPNSRLDKHILLFTNVRDQFPKTLSSIQSFSASGAAPAYHCNCHWSRSSFTRFNQERITITARTFSLVLAELKPTSVEFLCDEGSRHTNVFNAPAIQVIQVIKRWRSFTEMDPYDTEGRLKDLWRDKLEDMLDDLPSLGSHQDSSQEQIALSSWLDIFHARRMGIDRGNK